MIPDTTVSDVLAMPDLSIRDGHLYSATVPLAVELDSLVAAAEDDELARLVRLIGEDDTLYRAILAGMAGRPVADLQPIISEWAQHWPVIDADMNLTGEAVDSDDDGYWNYDDEAMISDADARAGGWQIATGEGYACPPAMRDLCDSHTNEVIGQATADQIEASDAAGPQGHVTIVAATGEVVREDEVADWAPEDLRRVYVAAE